MKRLLALLSLLALGCGDDVTLGDGRPADAVVDSGVDAWQPCLSASCGQACQPCDPHDPSCGVPVGAYYHCGAEGVCTHGDVTCP